MPRSKASKPYDIAEAEWQTSTRSGNSGNCVRIARNLVKSHGVILVGDSKNPDQPALEFTMAEWDAFVGGTKDGEFDL